MPRDFRRTAVAEPRASTEGQRRCARDGWCRDYDLGDDGVRLGAVTPRAFCDADTTLIGRCLREMPGYFLWLGAEMGSPAQGDLRIRLPFGPRVPLRVDIDALRNLTVECLVSWHERVADVARLVFPSAAASRQRRDVLAVKRAADVLGAHLAALLALEPVPVVRFWDIRDITAFPEETPGLVGPVVARTWMDLGGADAGLEILNLHYLARAVLGETRQRPQELEGVPCRMEDCPGPLARAEPPARAEDPESWSECLSCADRMSETAYREWVALCAAYERNTRRVPVLENLPGVDDAVMLG